MPLKYYIDWIWQLDVGSGGGAADPVWHYHSNYDTYHWMSTFGDPGFNQHRAVGQYLALVAFHLADDDVLPIDVQTYTTELRAYRDDLVDFVAEAGVELDISELNDAIEVFASRADEIKKLDNVARTTKDANSVRLVNHKYAQFQRGFVSQGGLPDREFYKHVVLAPGLDTGKHLLPQIMVNLKM